MREIEAHPGLVAWVLREPVTAAPRSARRLQVEWSGVDWGRLGVGATFAELHKVKRHEMLRITVRDLADAAPLDEIVGELSALADFCLQRALDACRRDMQSRHGEPRAEFSVFGMGKLGGMELNYSSDVDLIFVYSEEGTVGRITHHEFFNRVAETLVKGFRGEAGASPLYRVDLRLRPEGNSGPITRSLESYEHYYAAFGEVWERMALQKARLVAGDAELGYEFTQHLQPFCFPKHLPPSALQEIARIKSRIEDEILKEGGLDRHVKLGRGGIREIEFGVQSLQLLHGAHQAFSQERGTLRSLQALQRLDLLPSDEAAALTRAYVFLRRLEHRLQMREDRQTHVVPSDQTEQEILAKGLGFRALADFDAEWKSHTGRVHAFFDRIMHAGEADGAPVLPVDWGSPPADGAERIRAAGFRNGEKTAATLRVLALGPEYAHVSQRTRGFFNQLAPHLLALGPSLARPDFALQQFERFIEAYGSRASLYELLASNPKVLELLLKLFDHSLYLTDIIVRQPGMLEAIAFEGLLVDTHDRPRMEATLASEPAGDAAVRLRRFHSGELLRIELRDILGLASAPEETASEISILADVCLAEAVQHVAAKGFAVIALGKFGGRELSYGSDLDVIFIGGTSAAAAAVLAMMGKEGREGIVFRMDARLRPDGQDSPLTLSLAACRNYYAKRAHFWERQALTRARACAGDARAGAAFLKMVDEVIYSRAMTDAEMGELKAMRLRIEKERGDPDDRARDFKTGAGGLVDVEFLAQAMQLRHGWNHKGLRRAATMDVLRTMPSVAGWDIREVDALVEDYRWLRSLEGALRRFHNAPVEQMPASRAEWDVPAKHLGLKDAAALEAELTARRKRIRERVSLWME